MKDSLEAVIFTMAIFFFIIMIILLVSMTNIYREGDQWKNKYLKLIEGNIKE